MKEPNSKCKNNTKFKGKYKDAFLVFAVLMITGVLLAVSAYAQFDPQMPGDSGLGDFSAPDMSGEGVNQQPAITALESNKLSPQEAGSTIKWTAKANDPEDDPMSFIFRLKGPSTGDLWKPVNKDISDKTWEWNTNSEDAGNYQISVSVRDEMHAGPQFIPDEKIVDFLLTPPPEPSQAQEQPAVETIPVETAPEQTYVPPSEEQQTASQEQMTQPQETKTVNQAPVMTSLTPVPASPQEAGIVVTWEAIASDQESDSLQFQFLLDGSPVTDWQYPNQWTWTTSVSEIGVHSIEARVRDGAHNADGDSSKEARFTINKPNEKPVISDLSPDKASPQEIGSIVTWTAQADDTEKNPILYRFFLNGLPTTDWQSRNKWAWTASEGESQIEVQVRDGKHAEQDGFDDSKSASFTVMPPNQNPNIINFSPDKQSPQETGSTITWTVEVMDAENDPLQFQFSLDGQVMQEWSESPVWSWTATNEQVGQHAIEAKVRDGKHNPEGDSSKSANFEIVLPPNNAPVLETLTPDKESPQVTGTAITWTVVAPDVENDPLQFQFSLDGQVMQDWSESAVWSWTATNEQVGQHAIEAKVRDGKHNPEGDSSKSANFEIVLPPNNAPVLETLTPDKESPQVTGTAITWTVVAPDVENDPLQFLFSLDGQVMQDWSESAVWSWTATNEQVGQHAIEAKVRDGKHNPEGDSSKSANFEIVLPPNNAPVLSTLTADKESPQVTGTVITWTVVAPDVENDPLQFLFSLDGQVMQDWSESAVWSWTAAVEQVGQHAIEAKVRDGKHNPEGDSSKSANFEIVLPPNNAPVLSTLTADKESPQVTGTVITWTVVAPDVENDPLQFLFSLDGQVMQDWSESAVWSWTAAVEQVGQHAIEAKVRDGKHNQEGDSSKSANFEIVLPPNNAPVLSTLTADKESPQVTGTAITWTAAASDVETDPLSYRFLVNDTPAADWQPENQWTWTAIEPGTSLISVQVKDSLHEGAQGEGGNMSREYSIIAPVLETKPVEEPVQTEVVPAEVVPAKLNESPVITGLTTESVSPQLLGTTVTWTAQADDPESDPISYRFLVNDTPATDWQAENLWTWTAIEPGTSQILVQAKDDLHEGAQGEGGNMSREFSIIAPVPETKPVQEPVQTEFVPAEVVPAKLNESPVITGLTTESVSPQLLGTTVTWTAQADDPESDPISYRFLVNDTPATDWQAENLWTWTAIEPGTSQILVQAKDDLHEGAQGEGGNMSREFSIIAPVPETKPVQEPVQTEVVPAEVVPAKLNESPVITGLTTESVSPQLLGTTVTWTAQASDPESDPISYRFLVNGTPATEWQPENLWTWTAIEPGTSQILVQAKDSLHEGAQGVAGNMSAEFTINASAPVQEPAAGENVPPVTENITIPVAPENVTQQPVNETETVTVAPETVVPPADENITTPLVAENVTPQQPVNETKPVGPVIPPAENRTPVLNSLSADVTSPQIPGTTITWTANATDVDQDALFFRFSRSGPATSGAWQPVTEWGSANTWTQTTSSSDAGENQVKAQVRDGKHAAEDSSDSELTAFMTLSEPARNISGTVFGDKNNNGVKDEGEGLSGWTIHLVKPDNSEVSALTREDGSYRFEQLSAGSYTLREEIPSGSGWKVVNPESGSYSVDLGQSDAADKNFVNKLTSYSISGMKYNDLNGNGANDGEPGMESWTIQLTKEGSLVNSTTTGKDGSYKFADLMPGSYSVKEVEQSGWARTAPLEGSYSVVLVDADVTGKDFGNHGSWSISGANFNDLNGNGAKDGNETALAGWNIQLAKDGNIINATTTGQDGSYAFKNLAPGKYTVSEAAQEGWTQTLPQGPYSIDLLDADVSGKDFGNKGNLSITGKKFYDANANGVQDGDEPGLPGQEVKLVENGKEISTVTTGQDGTYTFSNLVPGTYEVDDPILVTLTTQIHIVVNVPAFSPNIISGMKFNDQNGNGVKDAGELGVPNWGIDLVYVVPGPDILMAQVNTDANGAYKFINVPHGNYEIKELARQGWTATTPTVLPVHIPGISSNQNFGNKLATPPSLGSIFGMKFNDLNGNGNKDGGDAGLSGWTIELKNATSLTVISTTSTAADGSYAFLNITPGSYVVSEVAKPGWTQTKPPVGPGGRVYSFTLAAGENKLAIDFANRNNNLPPVNPTLVSNLASPKMVGTPVIWTAGATDPEGNTLQFRFFVRGPTPSPAVRDDSGYSTNNVWIWNSVGYAPGPYQIEVWIRDGNHAGPTHFDIKKTVSFTLTSANLPPRVNMLFSDRPAPQFVGSWIKWTALASDPEGTPLQYKFYLRGPSTNGFWMDQTGWGNSNRWIWRTNPMDVGTSQVLVAVRDGNHAGLGGSDDYEIAAFSIINQNLPPVITGLASNVFSPQPIGATVWWKASAMDQEGNPVFFRYWLKGAATGGFWRIARDWSTDPTWVWPTSPADAGTSEIQVQVRDGMHSSPSGWDDDAGALFTVLRQNQPPALVSLKPDKPGSQAAGTPIKWMAVASDPDREPVFYKFWLKGPSTGEAWKVVADWSTKNQWTWASSGYDSGAYTVYVYARDGKHNPATGYDSALGASYLLTPNQPPKLTALLPDKKSPQAAGNAVKWTAKASDANKEPIFYRFWLKGPSTGDAWKVVSDWSINSQWTWTNSGSDSGEYTVYVYVRDGLHSPATGYDSALGASYLLTPNEPPKLTALLSDKKNPQSAGTIVKWTATATDANKDPILYRFWLMGPSTGNAWKVVADWSTKNQWIWNNAPTDAGLYRVFVYARDGKHAPATGYDSAVGQDYALLNQVVSKKVVVIGRPVR